MDKQKFLIGLGAGFLVGGILAVLFTPKSGKDNRAMIATHARKVAKVARDIHGRFKRKK